jgi:cell division protein FtsB
MIAMTPATATCHQPPIASAEIDALLADLVARWHEVEPAHAEDGLRGKVCDLHRFNFLLWHEDDIARAPDVTDSRIAAVKRAIDGYNQARNDAIEKVDDWLIGELAARGIVASPDAPAATETPGAAIDRLSILELRRYHMREQAERADATPEHRAKAAARMDVLDAQRDHLVESLDRLLGEIFAADRPLRVFRQMKMYNDPTMNPYLYKAGKAA